MTSSSPSPDKGTGLLISMHSVSETPADASKINCGCYSFLGEGGLLAVSAELSVRLAYFLPLDILNFGILNCGRCFERKKTCSSKNSVNDKILWVGDEQWRIEQYPCLNPGWLLGLPT